MDGHHSQLSAHSHSLPTQYSPQVSNTHRRHKTFQLKHKKHTHTRFSCKLLPQTHLNTHAIHGFIQAPFAADGVGVASQRKTMPSEQTPRHRSVCAGVIMVLFTCCYESPGGAPDGSSSLTNTHTHMSSSPPIRYTQV